MHRTPRNAPEPKRRAPEVDGVRESIAERLRAYRFRSSPSRRRWVARSRSSWEKRRRAARSTFWRAQGHRVLTDPSGVRREHLGARLTGSQVEFVRFVFPPGTQTGAFRGHQTGWTEHAAVAEGTIEVRVSGERFRLETGASIVFPSDQVHGYANLGTEDATIYVVVEPLIMRTGRNAGVAGDSHLPTDSHVKA